MTQRTGGAWVFLGLVVGLAIRAAWRARGRSRLGEAVVWLALLNLMSFRSPFVPDAYGLIGSLWLLTRLVATRPLRSRFIAGLGTLAFAFMWIIDGSTLTKIPLVISATLLTLLVLPTVYTWLEELAGRRESARVHRAGQRSGAGAVQSPKVRG